MRELLAARAARDDGEGLAVRESEVDNRFRGAVAMEAHEQVRPYERRARRRRGPGVVRRRHKVGRRRQELEPPVDLDVVLLARRLADEDLLGPAPRGRGEEIVTARHRPIHERAVEEQAQVPRPPQRQLYAGLLVLPPSPPEALRDGLVPVVEEAARAKPPEALAHVVEHRRPRVHDDASDVVQVLQLEAQLSLAARDVDDGRRPELFDDEPPEDADAARLREGRLRERTRHVNQRRVREGAAVAEVAHAAAHPMRARLRRRRRTGRMNPANPPVLAEERRDRRVDRDRRAAGDAGTRAPGELHLLAAAAINERRIDRSMRAAETRCSAAAARQRPLACSWRTTRQAEG
ncbi:unnamed protein product [Pelagomonas calceolata]|uniref:Uncharacterized protein n=1 Tax=Pelagomonas calceolata TaxID=35677 RepID=A0A8J2SDN6_9STRA|nr:unnamed protein product [Pelagomonas calceolata]